MMRTVIGVLLLALAILVPSVASAQSEQVYYYYEDATGSVRMITDATGQAIEWHDYQPFGEETLNNPQTPEPRLYSAKERDSETNYDYSMARYYAGINGRFTTVDPVHVAGDLSNPQTWNGYAYALNNPLRYVDLNGQAGDCVYGYDSKTGQCTGGLDSSDLRFKLEILKLGQSGSPSTVTDDPRMNNAICGNRFGQFFASQYRPASNIAVQYDVDVSLLLGLSAAESGWGTSTMYRNQYNPFGFTPSGDRTRGLTFQSYESAWNAWGRTYGPRVQGVGADANLFVDRLLINNQGLRQPTVGGDSRGPYNSLVAPAGDPNWRAKTLGTITGVRRRLSDWNAACE
jgi:RHS repeat-associated protein